MRNWFRVFFFWERRKSARPVGLDRRQSRVTAKAANDQLCASIDRLNQTMIRRREDLFK